jgi:hypothetical protein
MGVNKLMKTTIEFDAALVRQLKKQAAQQSTTLSKLVSVLVRRSIHEQETELDERFCMPVLGNHANSIEGTPRMFKDVMQAEDVAGLDAEKKKHP